MPSTTTTSKTTAKTKPAATPAAEVPAGTFMAYLEARTSAAADAPHQGFPFITEKGILRVKPSDWLEYLAAAQVEVAKRQALEALRGQGLVQRVYPLPAVEGQEALAGKSYGLYTGKATPAMANLPRRAGAAPAAPAATPAPQVAAAESNGGVAKVAASALAVGDAIGTTRTNSRKAIESGDGQTIAAITTSRDGRVQARNADGQVIRSLDPATQVWAGRDNAPSAAAHANA